MIIHNRYHGPRYSTDSTALNVSQFCEPRSSHVHPTLDRPPGLPTSYVFDELYPSLAVTTIATKPSIVGGVIRRLKALAITLHVWRGPVAHERTGA